MDETKKLLIVEDHPILRNGLKGLLADQPEFEVIGEVGTMADARAAIKFQKPDVVLLDVSLPDGSGLDILKEKELVAGTKVIVLTMHKEAPYINRAKELGACGFVLKDMAPEELVSTIQAVIAGESRFPEEILAEEAGDSQSLSPREQKVKELLVLGVSLTEIGKQLGLSVKTISTYRTRILAKMGVANNAELVKKEMRSNPLG